MDSESIPLWRLNVGKKATVQSLMFEGPVRRRMLDLGVIEGTEIAPLFQSPSGSPVAYMIRGAVIALRQDITSGILVREC